MSSIVNKVKDVLHSDKDKTTRHEGTHSSTHPTTGTHTTSAAEPRIHDTTTTGPVGGTTGTHNTAFAGSDNYAHGAGANRGASGPASKTDGPHNSNLLNKADPRVDSDRDHSKNLGMNPQGTATTGTTTGTGIGGAQHHSGVAGTTGPATRTAGPHESNLANKADPRVDSDRDHSRNLGMNPRGTATTGTTGGLGSAGPTGAAIGTTGTNRGSDGPATRTDGPHESNLANKVDPRVDSDRDHSRNLGANPHGTATTGTTGTTGLAGTHGTHTGTAGTSGTGHNAAFFSSGASGATGINRGTDGPATRTDGPHESNLANKADPRVDSDRDHSRNLGANPHGTATTGTTGVTGSHGTHTGTHGTHTGAHGTHAGTTGAGPGPAPNTAGPHKSDMLNKADPRVDSDLDGSKTFGGNKTTESMGHKDPTDAAQVPPSVLQKHIGAPTVEHENASHDRAKRHSVSHQEQHRGL
ncbi:cell surface protein, putative [Metarhizium acridum CQMa 102]|uniref:Cell surface protein, putative n=1 Tax=Metarhizium acridum (strain CQMa 102) TaxID=655827 RepID=E9E1T6_METAQ|nr:cell surface protein, putative [Metarhizium acridum CQMa 102]EFY90146.1 cell surface protein, putative [Metarhizium acridum CQMa 102]